MLFQCGFYERRRPYLGQFAVKLYVRTTQKDPQNQENENAKKPVQLSTPAICSEHRMDPQDDRLVSGKMTITVQLFGQKKHL